VCGRDPGAWPKAVAGSVCLLPTGRAGRAFPDLRLEKLLPGPIQSPLALQTYQAGGRQRPRPANRESGANRLVVAYYLEKNKIQVFYPFCLGLSKRPVGPPGGEPRRLIRFTQFSTLRGTVCGLSCDKKPGGTFAGVLSSSRCVSGGRRYSNVQYEPGEGKYRAHPSGPGFRANASVIRTSVSPPSPTKGRGTMDGTSRVRSQRLWVYMISPFEIVGISPSERCRNPESLGFRTRSSSYGSVHFRR